MFKIFVICVLLVLAGAFVFGTRGCDDVFHADRVFVETDDENFLRARELATSGRNLEAMDEFVKIISEHPTEAAESNFEIGLLAFNQRDYPLAIYHLKRYLALRPEASAQTRQRVVGMIDSSQKLFFQEIAGKAAPASAGISSELEAKYNAIVRENESLKREISLLKARLSRTPAAPTQPAPAVAVPEKQPEPVAVAPEPNPPRPEVPATHTVVPGDTLSSISKKYYGTSARWRDIYNANRVSMSSPSALRPGMVLKLPRP